MGANKKLGFAIYGCGMISPVHANSVLEIEDAELIGAADISYERATDFAKKYNVRAFSDYSELLNSEEVDAVCICTPSGTHADLAIEALRAKKNVILEKPMAITVQDCDRIIAACEECGKRLMVISQLREKPDIIRAKEIIASGKLGKIVLCNLQMKYYRSPEYYKGSWRGTKEMDGGGALMNQGVHGIDVISYLCGKIKPKSCQSLVRTLVHDIEVEDTAVAICEFESGALGIITGTTSVYPGFSREIEICGSAGTLIIRDGQIERLVIKEDGIDETYDVTEGEGKKDASATPTKWHKLQITRFIKALRGEDVPDLCDQHQGKIAVELIKRIYENSI